MAIKVDRNAVGDFIVTLNGKRYTCDDKQELMGAIEHYFGMNHDTATCVVCYSIMLNETRCMAKE